MFCDFFGFSNDVECDEDGYFLFDDNLCDIFSAPGAKRKEASEEFELGTFGDVQRDTAREMPYVRRDTAREGPCKGA